MRHTQSQRVLTYAAVSLLVAVNGLPAEAQSSGYFSEFEDGHVIREIGRDIVEAGCKVDHEAVVGIVAQNMTEFGSEVEGTPEDFWLGIFGNLQVRQQVELDYEKKLYVVTGTGECQ